MSLSSAISTSLTGLKASQAGLDLVSRNIANAGTVGYTKKVQQVTNQIAGNQGIGVSMLPDARTVDKYVLQQLRAEMASTSALSVYQNYLTQIDSSFGAPTSNSSIAASVSDLQTKLQAVGTTPDDDAARQTLINSASNLASQLNGSSNLIQNLRGQAEQSISDSVSQANALLQSVAKLNTQIAQGKASNISTGDLEDQRDIAINQLSQLMGVKTNERDDGTVSVFTTGGQLLVDNAAATLSFDAHTSMDASSRYNVDPSKRTVGTVTMTMGTTSVDLIASGAIKSGAIAGYIDLRDNVLPQAQAQLDELASQLALSLSTDKVAGAPVAATATTGAGYDLDLSSFLKGNSTGATGTQINFTYTAGGTTHNVAVVPVSDASLLPLPNSATANTGDEVIGVYVDPNASANTQMASIIAGLQGALPSSVTVSSTSGNTLSILDDNTGVASIDAASMSVVENANTLTNGLGTGLSLFVDGAAQKTYTGSLGSPSQITGFAGRIQVNSAVAADTTTLVKYQSDTLMGDDTRPNDLLSRLTDPSRMYSGSTGIGSTGTPYSGSIDAFARRIVSFQSAQAASSTSDYNSQKIVSDSLQSKFDSQTGVNIDEEMSNLIILQNAYSANARVITTIQALFQTLLSIGR